tara:strand:+ start:1022 stop:2149 length:1128 start_codon:yes stop_codon:yes gene_type:complete
MLKSDITPDPIRDPPIGEHQAPAPYMIVPARAFGDTRFNQFPSTFRCLALCSAHASARAGIFFCNQSLLASVMGSSQQAVSQHMNKLVKFGYIERLRKADPRRAYGSQGAKWRVIYDPRMNLEQAIANSSEGDDIEAQETLDKISTKPVEAPVKPRRTNISPKQEELAKSLADRYVKDEREFFIYDKILDDIKQYLVSQQTVETWNSFGNGLTSPIEKGYLKPNISMNKNKSQLVNGKTENKLQLVKDNTKYKSQLVSENKSHLVDNNYILTSNSNINEIEKKKICNNYMNIIQKHYGRAWSYDLRQVELAGDVLRAGYTIDSFNSDANGLVEWSKRNNKQPPQSLQYFIARKTNSKKPKEAIDIVKQMAGKMKL